MSTTAFFTSFAEWVVYRKGVDYKELFTGGLVIIGVSIIVNDLNLENHPDYFKAILLALISAFLAAFFSVINSVLVKKMTLLLFLFMNLWAGFG
jgi:drug/metabolite transporter (DMT)-like permease